VQRAEERRISGWRTTVGVVAALGLLAVLDAGMLGLVGAASY